MSVTQMAVYDAECAMQDAGTVEVTRAPGSTLVELAVEPSPGEGFARVCLTRDQILSLVMVLAAEANDM